MKLLIASDHAGFELKEQLKAAGAALGVAWEDLGTHSNDSVHYPDSARALCERLTNEKSNAERLEPSGVLICGSGVGVSMMANRFPGIRAALALRKDVAELSRRHNASNVLCLGARLVSPDEAKEILRTWLATPFEGGRHAVRVEMLDK